MDCFAVPDLANILFEGEAYGRLAICALRETTNSLANIYVNELSEDNLRHLRLKLELMRKNDLYSAQEAARVSPITGDCLQLHKNNQLLDLLHNRNPYNHFRLIMCANVIHFFDGAQVLKFFIDTFNYLKPGAKAYIFCKTRSLAFTQEQCVGNSGRMISRLAAEVYNAALRDGVSIFQDYSKILGSQGLRIKKVFETSIIGYL